ncbi:hypothetical protein GCM10010095_40210 [Streptomyces anthocyanicus]|nr:hypothetical protein GCM10010095_40210 [Streptomyces anthocyanicus]GHC13316.1 hypothetical protein GCM10010348_40610 [Streptomyces anthocyanicus]
MRTRRWPGGSAALVCSATSTWRGPVNWTTRSTDDADDAGGTDDTDGTDGTDDTDGSGRVADAVASTISATYVLSTSKSDAVMRGEQT